MHPDDPKRPRETALTHTADLCSQLSIDYMFWLTTHENEISQEVKCTDTKLEELLISEPRPFSQLSDHYAVMTTLHIADLKQK